MGLTRESVRTFLQDTCNLDLADVADDTPIFSSSRLDSFTMLDLIVFLETKGGFKMKATDVSLDNLDTVQSIINFCEKRSG